LVVARAPASPLSGGRPRQRGQGLTRSSLFAEPIAEAAASLREQSQRGAQPVTGRLGLDDLVDEALECGPLGAEMPLGVVPAELEKGAVGVLRSRELVPVRDPHRLL